MVSAWGCEQRLVLAQIVTPERLNEVVRSHWGVENRLHWRLDVVMNEDQDRSRLGNGPHNLAVPRHMAMNVMQKDGEKGSLQDQASRLGRGLPRPTTDPVLKCDCPAVIVRWASMIRPHSSPESAMTTFDKGVP